MFRAASLTFENGSLMSEMKAMAEDNRWLKKMFAKMAVQKELLKDALGKSLEGVSAQSDCAA